MADAAPLDATRALAGMQVLVTRARHQSEPLAALIDAHGGTAIRFPVIDIVAPQDSRAARAAMAKLDDYSLVIFVSPNAVEHGLAHSRSAPTRARMVAVGEGSAAASKSCMACHGNCPALVERRSPDSFHVYA